MAEAVRQEAPAHSTEGVRWPAAHASLGVSGWDVRVCHSWTVVFLENLIDLVLLTGCLSEGM